MNFFCKIENGDFCKKRRISANLQTVDCKTETPSNFADEYLTPQDHVWEYDLPLTNKANFFRKMRDLNLGRRSWEDLEKDFNDFQTELDDGIDKYTREERQNLISENFLLKSKLYSLATAKRVIF